MLCHAFLGN